MKSLFELKISPTRKAEDTLQVVREWEKRTRGVMAEYTRTAAQSVLNKVRGSLPTSREYSEYRKQLKLSEITGMNADSSGYLVHAEPSDRKVNDGEGETSIILIRPHSSGKISPQVQLLIRHGPWTTDTIPYMPSQQEAQVEMLRVSPREVARIRKARTLNSNVWRSKMQRLPGSKKIQKVQDRSVKSALGLQALRLEFGSGSGQNKPHWRPAILNLVRQELPAQAKDKTDFDRAMTSLPFRDWVGWPQAVRSRVPLNTVSRYVEFQKRLGLKLER